MSLSKSTGGQCSPSNKIFQSAVVRESFEIGNKSPWRWKHHHNPPQTQRWQNQDPFWSQRRSSSSFWSRKKHLVSFFFPCQLNLRLKTQRLINYTVNPRYFGQRLNPTALQVEDDVALIPHFCMICNMHILIFVSIQNFHVHCTL